MERSIYTPNFMLLPPNANFDRKSMLSNPTTCKCRLEDVPTRHVTTMHVTNPRPTSHLPCIVIKMVRNHKHTVVMLD